MVSNYYGMPAISKVKQFSPKGSLKNKNSSNLNPLHVSSLESTSRDYLQSDIIPQLFQQSLPVNLNFIDQSSSMSEQSRLIAGTQAEIKYKFHNSG